MNTTKYRYRVEYKWSHDNWEEYETFSYLKTARNHYKRLRPPKRLVKIKTELEVLHNEESTESKESSDHSEEME